MNYKILILYFFFLVSTTAMSQFGPMEFIGPPYWGVSESLVADLDGDGDKDIISGADNESKIVWFENLGGGNFSELKILVEEVYSEISIDCGDIDNDGDIDIASTSSSNGVVEWHENDGTGTFLFSHTLFTSESNPNAIHLADLDEDDDLDIILGAQGWDSLLMFENQGDGTFNSDTPNNLVEFIIDVHAIVAADFSGDGNLDILTVNHNFPSINLYFQEGDLEFSEGVELFAGSGENAINLKTGDIDSDGDIDIIFGGELPGLRWFENIDGNSFEMHSINLAEDSEYLALELFDVDGDDDLDLTAFYFDDTIESNVLTVFPYIGNQNFGLLETNVEINSEMNFMTSSDLNGDEIIDLITVSETSDQIFWIPHEGSGQYLNNLELTTSYRLPSNAQFVDLNQDSLPDILVSSVIPGKIAWCENQGDGTFNYPELLVQSEFEITDFALQDRDGDGDLDLFWVSSVSSSSQAAFGWNDNLGDLNFSNTMVEYEGDGHMFTIADLDSDGDFDIVGSTVSSSGEIPIIWMEQTTNGTFNMADTLTWDPGNFAGRLLFADLDNDDDVDILAQGWIPSTVKWYENLGSMQFSPPQILDEIENPTPPFLEIGDLDDDGDLDLVGKLYSTGLHQIVQYKNLGDGEFGERELIHFGTDFIRYMTLSDVNADNHIDIVAHNFTEARLIAFINAGDGGFYDEQYLSPFAGGGFRLLGGDLDDDNDDDLFGFALDPHFRFIKFENLFYSPNHARGTIFADMNQSGDLDSSDVGLNFVNISSQPEAEYVYSYDDGRYWVSFNEASNTVFEIFPDTLTNWGLTTGASSYVFDLDTVGAFVESLNFGFYPNSIHTDLESDLIGAFPRCNSLVNYWITIQNQGTSVPSGIVHLQLDNNVSYESSIIEPDSVIGQDIYWHFDSLFYFTEQQWMVEVQMPPVENMNDTLISRLFVHEFTEGDNEAYSDTTYLEQVLQCAYDPNDKTVQPLGYGSGGYIAQSEELEYVIRFQNMGTDTAFNVIVRDQLAGTLDLSTFSPISSSHPMQVVVGVDGAIEFHFYNIMLPDSGANYFGSQGYVSFKVKPNADLLPNTEIINEAEIYFDYNPPIITNFVLNTIECYVAPEPTISYNNSFLTAGVNDAAEYQWFLGGDSIEGANNESYFPTESGEYTVEVTDLNECSALSDAFFFSGLGVPQVRPSLFKVYPNPSFGPLTLELSNCNSQNHELKVYDILGSEKFNGQIVGNSRLELKKGVLQPGVYLIVVRCADNPRGHQSETVIIR